MLKLDFLLKHEDVVLVPEALIPHLGSGSRVRLGVSARRKKMKQVEAQVTAQRGDYLGVIRFL